jgi:hypothetical protein
MANIFAKMFGFPSAKPDLNQGTPISPDIPGFDELRKSIMARQLGFGPEFVERTTSPVIAEREAGFGLRERPALEESFASRGLGRSTIAGRDIGRAFAQKERDINQLIAEATMQDLLQKKSDISSRDESLFSIGTAEAQQQNLAAQNEQQRRLRNIGFDQERAAAESAAINRSVGVPLAIGAATATGNPALALGAFGIDTGGMNNSNMAGLLKKVLQETPAAPGRVRGTSKVSGGTFENIRPEDLGF